MFEELQILIIRVLIVVLVLLILVGGIFLCGRYGWKIQGFWSCEVPQINNVTVADGYVYIDGTHIGVPPKGFMGYLSDEIPGEVHIGLRFDGFFGIFEDNNFSISVPVDSQITKVYLVDSTGSHLIWSEEKGLIKN